VQDVLKEVYPNLINAIFAKVTAIKITEKDKDQAKMDKLQQIIDILNEGKDDDDQFKKLAAPALYKSQSKEKKIESTITTNNNKLKAIVNKTTKKETISDSLHTDSITKTKAVDTSTVKNTENNTPVTNSSDNTVSNNTTIAAATNANTNTKTTVAANTNSTAITSTTNTANTGVKKYYIINGSYKTEADAQAAVTKLKAQGYNAEIPGKNSYGDFRVSYNSYADKAEAQKELEQIKGKIQADAWLLEQ
jgi:cell division septation protein DedD